MYVIDQSTSLEAKRDLAKVYRESPGIMCTRKSAQRNLTAYEVLNGKRSRVDMQLKSCMMTCDQAKLCARNVIKHAEAGFEMFSMPSRLINCRGQWVAAHR